MKKTNFIRHFGYAFALTIFLISSCGNGSTDVVPAPTAEFSHSVDEMDNLNIDFLNESANAASYSWNFGDDTETSSVKNPSHSYASEGTYTVTLTVTNSVGATDSKTTDIAVESNATGEPIEIAFGKVSILGDSYATFSGHVTPSSNDSWYPHWEGPHKNDVVQVEQTWWHQLLEAHDGILEVNNSYSGATICNTGYNGDNSAWSSFITRMTNLGEPNTIIIMGGTNDAWANSPIGNYKYSGWTENDKKSFRPAFAFMLDYLTTQHPDATIINVVNDGLKAEITDSQEVICTHYNVTNIQLNNINKQEGHPSISGMAAIKNQISSVLFP